MQCESNLRTALLLLLLSSPLFALNPCSTCFSTFIGLIEDNGTINASVFVVNQSTVLLTNISYFDSEVKKFFTGEEILNNEEGIPGENPVSMNINATSLRDALVYFYYYNRTGSPVEIEGCNPVSAGNLMSVSGQDFYYATCTIPYELYSNSSVTVFVQYKGNQTLKPSEREMTIYDLEAGGINVLSRALLDRTIVDPSNPVCLAGMLMAGLLLASMYFSGRSPLGFMDISVPRVPKPKPYGFAALTAGTGNIRLAMSMGWDRRFLDALINRYASIDFRGKIRRNIQNEIMNAKGVSSINKYFAMKAAAESNRPEDDWKWRNILRNADERELVRNARNSNLPYQLMVVMEQRVAASKVISGMGIVGGERPKWLNKIQRYTNRIPLIGTFLGVATGSIWYAKRTAGRMAKAGISPPVRHVLEKIGQYEKVEGKPKPSEGKVMKKLRELAALTDTRKMEVGKLFQINAYAKRFYDDARESVFDEITNQIIWHEAYEQLAARLGRDQARKLVNSLFDFKGLFKKDAGVHELIKELKNVVLHEDYLKILRDANLSPQERAERMLATARTSGTGMRNGNFIENATDAFKALESIHLNAGLNDFEKAEQLVNFLRSKHHINKPYDLSHDILDGKFFLTTGRNSLFYEENGAKKNFGFLTLALKEYGDQMAFLSLAKDPKTGKPLWESSDAEHHYSKFSLSDAFSLSWLKFASQVFGHRGMYSVQEDITIYDPSTGKTKQGSFMRDILGLRIEDLKYMVKIMEGYLSGLLTGEGMDKLTLMADKASIHDLLYSYDIKGRKKIEEGELKPWKRRQWYLLQSETYPEQRYWRANMNFLWTSIPSAGDNVTVAYEVRGQKYWANMPRPEPAWHLMEMFMDTRLANMLNGAQWDFFGYDHPERFNRFSRVDMYKWFNETWRFYEYANKGLHQLHEKTGAGLSFDEFLAKPLTYEQLRKSPMPLVYTHDMSYVPYTKGMPVSDFDRIVNGIFILEDKDGKRLFDANKQGQYINEIQNKHPELQAQLDALAKLKRPPSLEDVDELSRILGEIEVSPATRARFKALLAQIKNFATSHPTDATHFGRELAGAEAAAAELKKLIGSLSLPPGPIDQKQRLMVQFARVDPAMQPLRTLTQDEINTIRDLLLHSSAKAEVKLMFMQRFSEMTHDWYSLWSDPGLTFFRLASQEDAGLLPPIERIGKVLRAALGEKMYGKLWELTRSFATGWVEPAVWAAGRVEAEAMSNNVSVSELYRERGHDIRMRVKAGVGDITPFLDDLPARYTVDDKIALTKDYHAYTDSFQRFFVGWMDSVTRDPRGSSTQWGKQWYLATMYHRGGAMHTEAHEFGGERTFLSPIGWFFAQTFTRSLSLNWMLGSPFVRMMRGFQTAAFGYPTIWDKNITPAGDFDLMQPWQTVHYSTNQKIRALFNPAEAVFTLKNFDLKYILTRPLHITPGLSMLSYFFPTLFDPAKGGGPFVHGEVEILGKKFSTILGNLPGYSTLSKMWGVRSLLQQTQTQRSGRGGIDIVDALKQTPEDFLQYKGGAFVQHFTDSANPGVSYVDYTGRGRLAARMGRYLVSNLTGKDNEDLKQWRDFFGEDEYVRRQATFSMARRGIAAEAKRLQFQQEMSGYGPGQNPMWAPLTTLTLGWWGGKWLLNSPVATVLTAATAAAAAPGILGLPAVSGLRGWLGVFAAAPQAGYQLGTKAHEYMKRKIMERNAAIAAGKPVDPVALAIFKGVSDFTVQKMKSIYAEFGIDVHTCMFCNRAKVRRGALCPSCGKSGG